MKLALDILHNFGSGSAFFLLGAIVGIAGLIGFAYVKSLIQNRKNSYWNSMT